METISILETFSNPTGIICISNGENNKLIIAFPYEAQGQVYSGNCISEKFEKLTKIHAHDSKIQCLSINKEGRILVTASNKDTIIRLFTIYNGDKLSEFRREKKM